MSHLTESQNARVPASGQKKPLRALAVAEDAPAGV
jgi:hypothetical protein